MNGAMVGLSEEEITRRLSSLKGWQLKGNAITKEVKFSSFKEAMQFVNKVAELAEAANHHPDIEIKYDRVILTLISHDVHALTKRDFNLAEKINALQS